MKRSSLIGHTVELLDLFRTSKTPADRIFKDFCRKRGYLGAKDRRYLSETYYAILRSYTSLELWVSEVFRNADAALPPSRLPSIAICAAFLVRIRHEDTADLLPDIADLFRMAVTRIRPEEFVSAVLVVAAPQPLADDPVSRIAVQESFPPFIVAEWLKEYGMDGTEALCHALNQPAPTILRVNLLKTTVDECRAALAREGVAVETTPVAPTGLRLKTRADLNVLRSFKDGWFEVQDEASQLIAPLLEPRPGQRIIDACAGGGGKALHIGALMGNQGTLVAIDTDQRRLGEIRPRAERAGLTIVEYVQHQHPDQLRRFDGSGDGVLVDAPCSGVGTFRRNPGEKLRLEEAQIAGLARAQELILQRAAQMVRPGGRLVYSTCTLLARENEGRVGSFLAKNPEFSLLDAPAILRRQQIAVSGDTAYLKLLPHQTGTDGFFAAAFERKTSVDS
jgi:16S rRNA (cytosine967-C5)-methyltransferase